MGGGTLWCWKGRAYLSSGIPSGPLCRPYLQVIELSDTAFYPDQIHRLSRMRILMGVHGAGLGNMIWMGPEAGGLIEVMHNAGGLNTHYAQMGEWTGQLGIRLRT